MNLNFLFTVISKIQHTAEVTWFLLGGAILSQMPGNRQPRRLPIAFEGLSEALEDMHDAFQPQETTTTAAAQYLLTWMPERNELDRDNASPQP